MRIWRINIHLFMLALLSNAGLYFAGKGFPWLAPRYFIAAAVVVAVFSYIVDHRRFMRRDNRLLILSVAGMSIILAFYAMAILGVSPDYGETTIYERNRILFYIALLLLAYSIRSADDTILVLKYVFTLSLFSVCMNIVDLALMEPDLFSYAPGRAAGLYKNPNIAGRVLIISSVLSLFVIPPRHWPLYLAVIGFGVLMTLSRGALLVYLISLGTLFYFKVLGIPKLDEKALLRLLVKAGVVVAIVALFFQSQMFQDWYDETSEETSVIESRLGQMSSPDEDVVVQDSRFGLLMMHWNAYLEHPILGNGLGFSQNVVYDDGIKAGSHNQLVYNLNEYGLIGAWLLGFYLCTLGAFRGCKGIWRRPIVATVFVVLTLYIFFTHSYMSLFPDAVLFVVTYKVSVFYKELMERCVGFRGSSVVAGRSMQKKRLVG